MKKSTLITIAGGSSNGKSGIMEELAKRGYRTYPEPANVFLTERKKEQGEELYSRPDQEENIYRQTEIYKKMVEHEENLRNILGVHFVERSAIECLAFNEHFLGGYLPIIEELPFDKVDLVFIPGMLEFKSDGIRTEKDEKQARAIHDTILRDYFEAGYRPHLVPKMEGTKKEQIEKRTDFVMRISAEEGLLDDVYRFNSNADWDEKIKWMKDNNEPLKKIHYKLYDYFSSESSERVLNPTQISNLIRILAPQEGFSQGDSEIILSSLESEDILVNLEKRF